MNDVVRQLLIKSGAVTIIKQAGLHFPTMRIDKHGLDGKVERSYYCTDPCGDCQGELEGPCTCSHHKGASR